MYSCIVIDDEEFARDQLAEYVSKVPFLGLLGVFENPLQAMGQIEDVDIVFTDINMPEMDGISFVKSLSKPPVFIFATGNADFAAQSFDLDVLDFLVKPFGFPRFLKAANKAKEYLDSLANRKKAKSFMTVKDWNKNVVVDFQDICFVKASRDFVVVQTKEKSYMLWRTLSSMEAELWGKQFLRVHKSYIVRLDFVKSISATRLTLKGNFEEIPIGKQYKDAVFSHFGIA